jgi:hypothetical protein
MPSNLNQPDRHPPLKGSNPLSPAQILAQQELRAVFGDTRLRVSSTATGYWTSEPTKDLGFDQALRHLKAGRRVTRAAWGSADTWLEIQRPDTQSKMTRPYLYLTRDGERFPVDPSGESVLANDWILLDS